MRPIASARRVFANWVWLAVLFGLYGAGWILPAHAQNAVCAEVKIEIKQKLSLERQAFDAVMRINNGLQTDAIQGVGVNLTFQDQAGNGIVATSDPNNTSASFFVRINNSIAAIDGTGSVSPKTTGKIHWLIIPAAGSGGIQPQVKLSFVGTSLSYTMAGKTATVAVTPDSIHSEDVERLVDDVERHSDLVAADFFAVEVWSWRGLMTHYVLFVIDLATRRIHIAGITAHPNANWMMQVGRNLLDVVDGPVVGKRYLLLDRDTKYCAELCQMLAREGIRVIRLPPRTPNLNAYAERWVRSVRDVCLSKLIPIGQGMLRRALREYVAHHQLERNHQGLSNTLIAPCPVVSGHGRSVIRRSRLRGILNYYERLAA